MKNPSEKGSSFERKICKEFSLWYSGHILNENRNDIFWRTSGSGARATVRSRIGLSTSDSYGDIQAIHTCGKVFTEKFLIEIKRGYSNQICVLCFIDSKNTNIIQKWLDKATKELNISKRKEVLLIFKRDRKETCICLSKNVFDLLKVKNYISINNEWFILNLAVFFECITPNILLEGI